MTNKKYLIISGIVFCAISLLHLVRAVLNLQLVVADWNVPLWISWVIFIATGSMSILAFRLAKK